MFPVPPLGIPLWAHRFAIDLVLTQVLGLDGWPLFLARIAVHLLSEPAARLAAEAWSALRPSRVHHSPDGSLAGRGRSRSRKGSKDRPEKFEVTRHVAPRITCVCNVDGAMSWRSRLSLDQALDIWMRDGTAGAALFLDHEESFAPDPSDLAGKILLVGAGVVAAFPDRFYTRPAPGLPKGVREVTSMVGRRPKPGRKAVARAPRRPPPVRIPEPPPRPVTPEEFLLRTVPTALVAGVPLSRLDIGPDLRAALSRVATVGDLHRERAWIVLGARRCGVEQVMELRRAVDALHDGATAAARRKAQAIRNAIRRRREGPLLEHPPNGDVATLPVRELGLGGRLGAALSDVRNVGELALLGVERILEVPYLGNRHVIAVRYAVDALERRIADEKCRIATQKAVDRAGRRWKADREKARAEKEALKASRRAEIEAARNARHDAKARFLEARRTVPDATRETAPPPADGKSLLEALREEAAELPPNHARVLERRLALDPGYPSFAAIAADMAITGTRAQQLFEDALFRLPRWLARCRATFLDLSSRLPSAAEDVFEEPWARGLTSEAGEAVLREVGWLRVVEAVGAGRYVSTVHKGLWNSYLHARRAQCSTMRVEPDGSYAVDDLPESVDGMGPSEMRACEALERISLAESSGPGLLHDLGCTDQAAWLALRTFGRPAAEEEVLEAVAAGSRDPPNRDRLRASLDRVGRKLGHGVHVAPDLAEWRPNPLADVAEACVAAILAKPEGVAPGTEEILAALVGAGRLDVPAAGDPRLRAALVSDDRIAPRVDNLDAPLGEDEAAEASAMRKRPDSVASRVVALLARHPEGILRREVIRRLTGASASLSAVRMALSVHATVEGGLCRPRPAGIGKRFASETPSRVRATGAPGRPGARERREPRRHDYPAERKKRTPGPTSGWDDAMTGTLRTMLAEDRSRDEIAATLGISRNAVVGKASRMGLIGARADAVSVPSAREVTRDSRDAFVRMLSTDMTLEEIASRLGTTTETLEREGRRLGLFR